VGNKAWPMIVLFVANVI